MCVQSNKNSITRAIIKYVFWNLDNEINGLKLAMNFIVSVKRK